jgi:[methyl-Co(III) methanol-specific corrinoid protein]:coenzyme M methyltransferase
MMKPTPHNLFMSALYGGRKGERPPSGNPISIVCHGLMDAVGISFPEAHLDAQAMAGLALAGHEIVGSDTVMPEYSVH